MLAATEAVCPALEILDSRYPDYKFTLPDVVADNTSAGRFVLGATLTRPAGIDLRLVGCTFERNGALAGTAAGAASLGHPAGGGGRPGAGAGPPGRGDSRPGPW